MLVRRGYVFNVTSRLWSDAHRKWLAALSFDNEVDRIVVTEYKLAVEQAERRLRAMDSEIEKAAQLPLYREHVAWLRCFRGIDTTIAMIFVAENHGVRRFDSPRALAAYWDSCPVSAQVATPRVVERSPRPATDTFDAHSSKHLGSIAITPALARNYVSAKKVSPNACSRSLTRLNVASPDVIDDSPPVGRTATRSSSLSRSNVKETVANRSRPAPQRPERRNARLNFATTRKRELAF